MCMSGLVEGGLGGTCASPCRPAANEIAAIESATTGNPAASPLEATIKTVANEMAAIESAAKEIVAIGTALIKSRQLNHPTWTTSG